MMVPAAPITDSKVRHYGRHLFAGASHEAPDAQGRITVPPHLRDYAGLTKDCAVVGANTRLEVWDHAAWQEYLAATEQDYADVAEEVLPALQMDHAGVEVVSVESGVVQVRLTGTCSGCPATVQAVIMGIEHELRRRVPGVEYLEAVP